MSDLATDFKRLSAISLILFVGSLVTESSATRDRFTGLCTAYCDSNGQLVDEFDCTGSIPKRFRSTRSPRVLFCCGNATAKYCCSDIREFISLDPKTDCGNNNDNNNNNNDKDSTKNSDDWVIIVAIIMTAVFLLLGLIGSLCLCHRRCQCKNTIYSENGDIIRPPNRRQTRETGRTTTTTPPDFDPTSPCAFAPPAYETLAKNPPSYCEIFTISHSSTNDLSRSPSSESPPPSTAICEASDAWSEEEEEEEEEGLRTGRGTPQSPQNLGPTEEDSNNYRMRRVNVPSGLPPPAYGD